jgi:hypothetical protein
LAVLFLPYPSLFKLSASKPDVLHGNICERDTENKMSMGKTAEKFTRYFTEEIMSKRVKKGIYTFHSIVESILLYGGKT